PGLGRRPGHAGGPASGSLLPAPAGHGGGPVTPNQLLSQVGVSGFGWLFEALDACGEVMAAEGVTMDRGLPMTVLAPPECMRGTHMGICRAHVRELCQRWKASSGKRDAARRSAMDGLTRAELLLGLVEASLRAPLDRAGMALYS